MATLNLWNTELGDYADYEVTIDGNGDIVAEHEDTLDVIKFPGGISKKEFESLVEKHNEKNFGVKAVDLQEINARDKKNQEILDSLS